MGASLGFGRLHLCVLRYHWAEAKMKIDKPGVYEIAPEVYHADGFLPAPAVSASILKILLRSTPRHAWHAHAALNPKHEPENRQIYDKGSAAHTLLLKDARAIKIIDADSYRTKAAQEERAAAYVAGSIPLLTKQWQDAAAMADAARLQLLAHEVGFIFANGKPEQTLVWQEGDIWCKAMLDWLPNAGPLYPDYKSTGGSAAPQQWERAFYERQYQIQAAFYRRGIRKVLKVANPQVIFVVQENEAPYCLSVLAASPAAMDMADREVEDGLRIWQLCLSRNEWPGYPSRVATLDPLPWQEAKMLEREIRAEQEPDLHKRSIAFQAPLGVE